MPHITSESSALAPEPGAASGYRPPQPVHTGALFTWPPQPRALFKYIAGFPGYLWPWMTFFVALATVSWLYLTPPAREVQEFSPTWVALVLVRNILLLVLFVGFWHLRFYVQKAQGTQYKYSPRWLSSANPSFLFRNQLWDNIFLSICSGATIWTLYEAVALWLHANDFITPVTWHSRPVYFTAFLLITPLWLSSHFYVTHRLLHWRPLYKYIHSTHHRNVNFGPWSGLAMHPLEHVVYFSGVALFWIVPSHPVHSLFPLFHLALAASLGHNGFDRVALTGNSTFNIGHYMHFLHHKYVTVNYGNETVPLDKWLGTLYDGTAQTRDALRGRQRPSQARP